MFVVFLFIYFWEDLTHCELIFFSLIFINRFFKKKKRNCIIRSKLIIQILIFKKVLFMLKHQGKKQSRSQLTKSNPP
jgi:hypothetical protein